MPQQIRSLTLADARHLIAAGEKQARDLGVPYSIAVVDAGGGLIAHVQMDGALLGSVDIAIAKAWTACAFDMTTEDLAKLAQSGYPLFGIGGTVDQDLKVAQAAISAFVAKGKTSSRRKAEILAC